MFSFDDLNYIKSGRKTVVSLDEYFIKEEVEQLEKIGIMSVEDFKREVAIPY